MSLPFECDLQGTQGIDFCSVSTGIRTCHLSLHVSTCLSPAFEKRTPKLKSSSVSRGGFPRLVAWNLCGSHKPGSNPKQPNHQLRIAAPEAQNSSAKNSLASKGKGKKKRRRKKTHFRTVRKLRVQFCGLFLRKPRPPFWGYPHPQTNPCLLHHEVSSSTASHLAIICP